MVYTLTWLLVLLIQMLMKTVRIALQTVMDWKVLLLQLTMMLDQIVRNYIVNSLVVVVLHAVAIVGKDLHS